MRTWLLALVVLGILAGCADPPPPTPEAAAPADTSEFRIDLPAGAPPDSIP